MPQQKQQQDVSMSMDATTHANNDAHNANATSNNPALAFCEAILDWNATGVVFLQHGQHAQALACFDGGLNGFGICLQNIFLPQNSRNTNTSTAAAAATIREVLKMTVINSNNNNHIATNADARTPESPNPTIPVEEASTAPQAAAMEARPEDSMDTIQDHPVAPEPTPPPTAVAPTATAVSMGPLLQSVPVGRGDSIAAAPTAPQPQAQPSNAAAADSSSQAKRQAAGSQTTNQQDQQAAEQAEQSVPVVLQDVTDVFFDVYQCALVFVSPRGWCQSEEQQAQYVTACMTHAAAVLLYNAGLTLHQLAEQQQTYSNSSSSGSTSYNSRRPPRSLDFCLAHETYRMALYLLEENALRGVHVAPYNILLLALFNNLGNLNGQHFFDIQRVLLCQEKLLCVFLQTEFDVSSSQQQRDDYVFFYMQLLLSFTRTPLLAPAA